ncbi:hypothetical protein IID62_04275 [candidate division KSB1 bacterium]|nr:hypothetical protein [candidate division KSB1 bacterium]
MIYNYTYFEKSVYSVHSISQSRKRILLLAAILLVLSGVYPFLIGSSYKGSADLHGIIEMVGSLMGLIAGISLITRFYNLGNRFQLYIGLAFFINGSEDFIHGLLSFSSVRWLGGPASSLVQFIPGTYVTGRLLMGVILIIGLIIPVWMGKAKNLKKETLWTIIVTVIITMVVTIIAFMIPLPNFVYQDRLISRPIDFLSAIVLAVAFIGFVIKYLNERSRLIWWIALSIGINVVGQVIMSFSKELYDPYFDIAHTYKVLGYFVPLLGFSFYQISIILELRQAEEELRSLDQMKNNFVASVSHELRTPLTSIKGSIGLLLADYAGKIDKEAREFLDICYANTERLIRIINDLLDLSKFEEKKKELKMEEFDIADLINEVIVSLKPLANAHSSRLVSDLTGKNTIIADRDKIAQVLINLISNGIKFSGGGDIAVSSHKNNKGINIIVSDSGDPISKDNREKIFDKFVQVDNSPSRKIGGTGLGLSISKAIITMHNGKIWVESNEKGNKFNFTIPSHQ